jgi:hypothetical protein
MERNSVRITGILPEKYMHDRNKNDCIIECEKQIARNEHNACIGQLEKQPVCCKCKAKLCVCEIVDPIEN